MTSLATALVIATLVILGLVAAVLVVLIIRLIRGGF
jgi:hypothetical protein